MKIKNTFLAIMIFSLSITSFINYQSISYVSTSYERIAGKERIETSQQI